MLKKDVDTMKLFSFYEKILFIIAVFLNKLKIRILIGKNLLHEKHSFDLLEKKGYQLNKITNEIFNIEYDDDLLGKLTVSVRRRTSDLAVFEQVIERKDYQKMVDTFKDSFDTNADLFVVDAGANIGLFSLFVSRIFNGVQIYAIEPSDENMSILKMNLSSNKCNGVTPFKNALWDTNETVDLENGFRDGKHWAITAKPSAKGEIGGITLKNLLDFSEKEYIDILKIDIEGAEFRLFNDVDTLKLIGEKVKLLTIEIHEEVGDRNLILKWLSNNGFCYFKNGEFLIACRKII